MNFSMKTTLITSMLILMFFGRLTAQEIQLPFKISIIDKFLSPCETSLSYEYELIRNANKYSIVSTSILENGERIKKTKKQGSVEKKLIENILFNIEQKPINEILVDEFLNQFTSDSVNHFFQQEGDNYWITNEYQKSFIMEELTKPDKLKKNLESYFRNYDHTNFIDGPYSEISIIFHFPDTIVSLRSKSILWFGLPFEINGQKIYSPHLASLIGELIPKSKTNRKEQFEGKELFSSVIRETINRHRKYIDNLESKTYQIYLDSLEKKFIVTNKRVVNGTLSTNWDGEKRLNCKLRDSSMVSNSWFEYSNTIENGLLKYPISLILSEYNQLYSSVMNSTFFHDYIASNGKRKLTIIYDDNSCFTNKSKKIALKDCKSLNHLTHFDNVIFISIENEYGNISRWGLLPNGYYFMWWNNGNPPTPINDDHFMKCD